MMLWFDVGSERYTTQTDHDAKYNWLWFDVGSERYTTYKRQRIMNTGCGLM